MKQATSLLLAAALLSSCDPIRSVTAIRELQAPLPEECVLSALKGSEVVEGVTVLHDRAHGAMVAEVLLPDAFVERYGRQHGIVIIQNATSVPPTLTVDTSIRDYDVPDELMQYLQGYCRRSG